ncbi:flavoprotein [Salinispora vitiensis]|uniref:flavoprotein n=1 Tax=Salinispora vitiensis TaxID=999544 RepID=UPI0003829252|nr:flavoprotein [Salinispora vitiensis]
MSLDASLATSQPASAARRMLYVLACGSPLARHIGRLVELAQQTGWEVCVVTTPDGTRFIDRPALVRQTGYPVRSHYKNPGDPDVLPPADAMIVCPATVNTITKWAAGIADTLPLGLLVEAQGRGVPLVAVPFTNAAMAAHPAFQTALGRLSEWGVTVLFGDHVVPLYPPGAGERHLPAFPWEAVVAALPEPAVATRVA